MKRIIIDLDETITSQKTSDYVNAIPNLKVINKLKEYKEQGFDIVIHTSRNVKTYQGNVGKINAFTLPIIIEWLNKFNVPYDEIFVGKPWCGDHGFYVDDKSIRPNEFIELNYSEIKNLLGEKV